MKKGFVVAVVLAVVVGLVWCGWQIYKPIPEDKPYVPQKGEVVSQSDNARGGVAKTVEKPKSEEKSASTILAQPPKEVKLQEKTGKQFDVSRLSQVRNRDEFLALMKESGAKYFDSSKGDMNITLNLKQPERGE